MRRSLSRFCTPLLALLCCIAFASCGAGKTGLSPASLPGSLGRPSDYAPGSPSAPRVVQDDLDDSAVYRSADEIDPLLPSQNVAVSDMGPVTFLAQEPGPGSALSEAAFCTYNFSVAGYDRSARVLLTWEVQPQGTNTWLALSNWDADRWDWIKVTDPAVVVVGDMARYISPAGKLLLIVFSLDTSQPRLGSLRLGAPVPVANLVLDKVSGSPDFVVHADAGSSQPGADSITRFEWDKEGDGDFELDTAAVSETDLTYLTEGIFQATVRVTNTAGETDTASVEVRSIKKWTHTFGKTDIDSVADAAVSASGEIYLAGFQRSSETGLPLNAAVIKLSAFGELIWAKAYSSAEQSNELTCAELDSDGNLVVGGYQDNPASPNKQFLVQKWSPEGEVLWSRNYGGSSEDEVRDLKTDGADIYLAGRSEGLALHAAALDSSGGLLWDRNVMLDNSADQVHSLALRYSALGVLQGIAVLGTRLSNGANSAWRVDFDSSGAGTSSSVLDNNSGALAFTGDALIYRRDVLNGTEHYLLAGIREDVGGSRAYILEIPPTGASVNAQAISGADFERVTDLSYDSNGNLLACGRINDGISVTGFLFGVYMPGLGFGVTRQYGVSAGNGVVGGIQPALDGFIGYGFAPDNSSAFTVLLISGSEFDTSWQALGFSQTVPDYLVSDSQGLSYDLAPLLTTDSGGGGVDALALFSYDLF